MQHSLGSITYASTHLWPSNWAMVGGVGLLFPNAFSRNWVAAHIAAAAALNRPLCLSEFGHYRDDSAASLLTRGRLAVLMFCLCSHISISGRQRTCPPAPRCST